MNRRLFPLLVVTGAACGSAVPSVPLAELTLGAPSASAIAVIAPASASASAVVAATPTPIADAYRDVAARIISSATSSGRAYLRLAELTDHVGNRLSGSPALDKAVRWATESFRKDGQENVHAEAVKVPHWVRGAESGSVTFRDAGALERRPLHLLALGGSVGTPRGGLHGHVIVVSSLDELERVGDAAKGKIVLFNRIMPPANDRTAFYGETVSVRGKGPSAAAKHGAIGVLVRSVTARSLRSPHTGATHYDDGVAKIPAAAVSIEDAELIARLVQAGADPEIELSLGAKLLPDADSANVVAELRGASQPEQIVLIGAHLDSWDVGQGALDDGAGVLIVMEALGELRRAGLKPRRTIRAVLYTNEENGLMGGKDYAVRHATEIASHVAAIEADTGAFAPVGFQIEDNPDALALLGDAAQTLAPLNATRVSAGHSGADIGTVVEQGVPGLGLWMDHRTYFDYHHSEADTLDKVDPVWLAEDVATLAVMAYVLADMPGTLPRGAVRPPDKAQNLAGNAGTVAAPATSGSPR